MFQMSEQLFIQCWPAIVARIEHERTSRAASDCTTPPPAQTAAVEAGYVLGVALGYAPSAGAPAGTGEPPVAPIPGLQSEACARLNWPGRHHRITVTRNRS